MIQKVKKFIPSSCQIGNTFFTHMAVVSSLSTNGDLVSEYIDKDDFITLLFHIGQPLYGGGTNYYTGFASNEYGTLTKHIPCQHGRLLLDVLIKSYTVVKHGRDHLDV